VLDRGRIVEIGTHRALLERGGIYDKLYSIQFAKDFAGSSADKILNSRGNP
jgi:ABC-type transport system involved in cytochrome bd biosynthesis fused ATPase/permease subunit